MKTRNLILTSMLALALLSGCATSVSASGSTASSVQTAETQRTSAGEIQIQFTDSGVTASARTGLSVSGSTVTISEAGTYRLSGTSQDGSILIQKRNHQRPSGAGWAELIRPKYRAHCLCKGYGGYH